MSGTAASGGNGPDAAFGDIFDSFVDDLDLDLEASDTDNAKDGSDSLVIDTPRATGPGGEGGPQRMQKRNTAALMEMADALRSDAVGSGTVSDEKSCTA